MTPADRDWTAEHLAAALRREACPCADCDPQRAVRRAALVDAAAEGHRMVDDGERLLELLAVIHRDGGHHTARVGVSQSCADALLAVAQLRERVDFLRAAIVDAAQASGVPAGDPVATVRRMANRISKVSDGR